MWGRASPTRGNPQRLGSLPEPESPTSVGPGRERASAFGASSHKDHTTLVDR